MTDVRVRITPEYPELVVSSDGRIKGPQGRWLRLFPDRRGYLRLNLYRDRKWTQVGAHAVVCTAFHGPRPVGQVVRHLNGDPADCRADNLAWGTHAENEADKKRQGRNLAGERHHQAKLTADDVRHIRSSGMTGQDLAALYEVSDSAISAVLHRKTWRHVL